MDNPKHLHWIYYFGLMIIGVVILFLISLTHYVPPALNHEYDYSQFFTKNFTWIARILFFIIAFLGGYFLRLNPWLTGLSLGIVFPLTSLAEATIYKGSHNLIPFEFAVHFVLALPAIIAAALGRFTRKQVLKRQTRTVV